MAAADLFGPNVPTVTGYRRFLFCVSEQHNPAGRPVAPVPGPTGNVARWFWPDCRVRHENWTGRCPPRTRQFLVLSQCICKSGKTRNEGKQAELITDFMYSNISFVIANLMNIVYHSQQNRGKVGLVTTLYRNMQAQSLVDSFDASPAPAI